MRDEHYIIRLCDAVLGLLASRQHKFDFLRGDPFEKGRRLPVDAFYPTLRLAIEYRERQHSEPVSIMDWRWTVSGCTRREQRFLYDERRRTTLPDNGIQLVELDYSQFPHKSNKRLLRRDPVADAQIIRQALARFNPVSR